MQTISRSELVDLLKASCAYQLSEKLFQNPTDFERLITDAVETHNPSYSISESASSVPRRERMAIVYLAWIQVCMIRASLFSTQSDISHGSDFSTDRSTPFNKCLKLAETLKKDYLILCSSLGIAGASSIGVSTAIITDVSTSSDIPRSLTAAPPVISLETPVVTGHSAEFSFAYDRFDAFAGLYVVVSANTILQPWNYTSKAGIPGIADDAEVIGPITDFVLRSVKLSELSSGTQKAVVAIRNVSGLYSFSNEVQFVVP